MRIDRLLVYLRFARTRSKACAMIDAGHMRMNGHRVTRHSEDVAPGDILTFPVGTEVRIVEVCTLPQRRGPPGIARSHYHELDRDGESALAANKDT